MNLTCPYCKSAFGVVEDPRYPPSKGMLRPSISISYGEIRYSNPNKPNNPKYWCQDCKATFEPDMSIKENIHGRIVKKTGTFNFDN